MVVTEGFSEWVRTDTEENLTISEYDTYFLTEGYTYEFKGEGDFEAFIALEGGVIKS